MATLVAAAAVGVRSVTWRAGSRSPTRFSIATRSFALSMSA